MTDQTISPEQREVEQDVVLESRNVTKRFPGVLANDSVNLKLRRGEILALLGENGAGKSTLMNIIYGLYQQDEGEVYLNGREVRFANPREAIHSGIGMVHQHFQLVDVMTVAENVILGEEKEIPNQKSLFGTFFTLIFGILIAALVVNYNHPLVYDTFVFALLALVLPWYFTRWIFARVGFSVLGLAAVSYAVDQFGLTYPDQYLFIDIVVILGLLGAIYGLLGFIPKAFYDWMAASQALLRRGLQVFAVLLLLIAGSSQSNALEALGAYVTAFFDAFGGESSTEFEILMALLGMGVIAVIGFTVPRILTDNPFRQRIENLPFVRDEPRLQSEIWFSALAIIAAGAASLVLIAVLAGLSATIWPETESFVQMREFLALISLGMIASAIVSLVLAIGGAAVFQAWDALVGVLRVIWGLAWRLALIAVALWIGSQARNISQMAIITNLLQTDIPIDYRSEDTTDSGATVGAGLEGSEAVSIGWRSIAREEGREAQISALLEEIDDVFLDEDTGEYKGISREWREAVEDVPPVVDNVVAALVLVLFGVISVSTWRGRQILPGALFGEDQPTLGNQIVLGAFLVLFTGTIFLYLDELDMAVRFALGAFSLLAIGFSIYRTVKDRQEDPDRIRPITPIDTVIDALTDFLYTVLSVRQTRQAAERVRELSRRYGLEVDPDAVIEKLPVGLQQRVEIVKALYRKADILILDEPTAVLTPQEGDELFKIMRELASQGVSIIFITHKLKEVFKVATNIVVMRGGKVVGTTTPQEATESSLAAMMVGREVILQVEKDEAKPKDAVLRVDNLRAMDDRGAVALNGVSLEVKAGEVLGVAGVQGNGQSEFVEVLTGLRTMDDGSVELLGQELRPRRYADATGVQRMMAAGLDLVVTGALGLLFSYFWSYFGEGPEQFEALSLQTLIIFLIVDAIYNLGFWVLPIIQRGNGGETQPRMQLDIDNGSATAKHYATGMTLGKLIFDLQISNADDSSPSVAAMLLRYVGQSISRYAFPFYYLLTALYAYEGASRQEPEEDRTTFYDRWNQILSNTWYDNIGNYKLRVAHRAVITPRKIKDLQTGHVPEDRLRFGMVKPFMVAENLILNDYYEAPHAQAPSGVQLPFISSVYAVLFASIFAFLGYLWVYLWDRSLWSGLLDQFGVPDVDTARRVPTDRAFSALQSNYLSDPLVISLLTLLVMTALFSLVAYLLTRLIVRYVANPFSFVPPLAYMAAVYIALMFGAAIAEALGIANVILPPLIQFFGDISSTTLDWGDALNQVLWFAGGLLLVIVSGVVYDWVRDQAEHDPDLQAREARLLNSPLGQAIQHQNRYGLSLNIRNTLGHSNRLIQEYDIRTPSAMVTGSSLSGGNQQKLVVAREFSRQPRLLIASQPTRGIDVGSIEFIHNQIIDQRDKGAAVLLVSAELDEVMSLSDRIAVMYKGEIIKVLDAKDASREELGLLMAGIKQ